MSLPNEHGPTPWWAGYLLTSPLRRLVHHPKHILLPFVTTGMRVLEPGPGRGFFTLELARLVGATGKVIAPELNPAMIAGLERRATHAKLSARIDARQASRLSLGISDLEQTIDFALSFAVAHETANPKHFFEEIALALKPQALFLLVEPEGHVPPKFFDALTTFATQCGLSPLRNPEIDGSQAVLLQKV